MTTGAAGTGRSLMPDLTWRPANEGAGPHLHGYDGQLLVAQVNHYDEPGGPHWIGHIRNRAVTERVLTAEEAQRLTEVEYNGRNRP